MHSISSILFETSIMAFIYFNFFFGMWFMFIRSIYMRIIAIFLFIAIITASIAVLCTNSDVSSEFSYYFLYMWIIKGIFGIIGSKLG